jgi:hydroxypyruvate isomerase
MPSEKSPVLSANLSMMFSEHDFLDRFAAAADAGFTHVEFQFPYDFSLEEIADQLTLHDLKLVMFNLPAGDFANGARGMAALVGRQDAFRQSVERAITYAKHLQCDRLNCLAGLVSVDDAKAHAILVENLRWAATRLARNTIKLMIEPINPFDMPGFFLTTPAQAMAVMRDVGHDNLYLQYDIYHAHRMGCDIPAELAALAPRIAHLQIADHPGRHEPGTGEIDFNLLFRLMAQHCPGLPIGLEYRPRSGTVPGLDWLQRLQD